MRLLLVISFIVCIQECLSQKYTGYRQRGYGQVSFTMYGNNEVIAKPGISIGAGALLGENITTGAGFDIYMFTGFHQEQLRFSQAYADFRAYFSGLERAGPFIAFQPGFILLKKEANMQTKSGMSLNALAGYFVRFRRTTGITASFGYGLLTYEVNGVEKQQHGAKFNVGFFF